MLQTSWSRHRPVSVWNILKSLNPSLSLLLGSFRWLGHICLLINSETWENRLQRRWSPGYFHERLWPSRRREDWPQQHRWCSACCHHCDPDDLMAISLEDIRWQDSWWSFIDRHGECHSWTLQLCLKQANLSSRGGRVFNPAQLISMNVLMCERQRERESITSIKHWATERIGICRRYCSFSNGP